MIHTHILILSFKSRNGRRYNVRTPIDERTATDFGTRADAISRGAAMNLDRLVNWEIAEVLN